MFVIRERTAADCRRRSGISVCHAFEAAHAERDAQEARAERGGQGEHEEYGVPVVRYGGAEYVEREAGDARAAPAEHDERKSWGHDERAGGPSTEGLDAEGVGLREAPDCTEAQVEFVPEGEWPCAPATCLLLVREQDAAGEHEASGGGFPEFF